MAHGRTYLRARPGTVAGVAAVRIVRVAVERVDVMVKRRIDELGGFAFPAPENAAQMGMTLRDWFAGQFLASIHAGREHAAEVARNCYVMADAMLKERDK